MKMPILTIGAAAVIGATACTSVDNDAYTDTTPAASTASAELRDATGQVVGSATATQSGDSIRVRVEASGLPQGAHGAHVHMTGQCATPGFDTAGGHWNPTNMQHGKDNPAGMHKGDMPNILIGADGSGTLGYTISGAQLAGSGGAMLDADGAAIVIHAGPDDYRTDPSGNSGARIACGVFGPA